MLGRKQLSLSQPLLLPSLLYCFKAFDLRGANQKQKTPTFVQAVSGERRAEIARRTGIERANVTGCIMRQTVRGTN